MCEVSKTLLGHGELSLHHTAPPHCSQNLPPQGHGTSLGLGLPAPCPGAAAHAPPRGLKWGKGERNDLACVKGVR